MKKGPQITLIATFMLALSTSSHASDIITSTGADGLVTRSYSATLTSNGTGSTPAGTGAFTVPTGFAGSGQFDGGLSGDSFTINLTASTGWDTTLASAAVTGGTFGTYLSGLTASFTDHFASGNAVGVGDNDVNIGDVLIFTIDISGIASGADLLLERFSFVNYGASDDLDYVFLDSETNTVTSSGFGVNVNGPDALEFGPGLTATNGDLIAIANVAGDNLFRFQQLGTDLTAIPEPAPATALALLFSSALAVGLLRRRRS